MSEKEKEREQKRGREGEDIVFGLGNDS